MWNRADNLYKIDPSQYRKILHNKITEKKYKLDRDDIDYQINRDTCNFTNRLNIKNKLNRKNAYITCILKDHKQNFENNKQARLINPIKTELPLISKSVIQNMVTKILDNSRYILWKNSLDTIKWF